MASVRTPYRAAHLRLDVEEPVVLEMPWATQRTGTAIARAGLGAGNSENIQRLADGSLGIAPIQVQRHEISERGDTFGAVLRASAWSLASRVTEFPTFRPASDLTGISYDAAVVAGDYFLAKRPVAGDDWSTLRLASDQSAYPGPTRPTANAPMDRIAVTSGDPHPPNQGYVYRFRLPGTGHSAPDFVLAKFFGGPIDANGWGEYCLSFTGAGEAYLHNRQYVSGSWKWVTCDVFRFAEPNRVSDQEHEIQVRPYVTPTGARLIEFRCSSVDFAASSSGNLLRGYVQTPSLPRTHLYRVFDAPLTAAARQVTGSAPARVDNRRDLRPSWQVSLLQFFATGLLIDFPFAIPETSQRNPLTIAWIATVPTGCSLTGKLYDATTQTELSLVSSSATQRVYEQNAGQAGYYAQFEFTSDAAGSATPLLFSYQVTKNGYTGVSAPGEFETPVQDWSVTGPDDEVDHESASCTVQDTTGSLTRLAIRGEFHAVLETEWDSGNPANRSVLMRGYAYRPKCKRKGTAKDLGFGGGGVARINPGDYWREFAVTLSSYSTRLKERGPQFLRALLDPNSFNFVPIAGNKVTDVIRAAFDWAGYPADMIDVPDLPYQLFGPVNAPELQLVDPLADLLKLISTLARDYLGYVLLFDGNAGTRGMWRVRPPLYSPYTNLAYFTGDGPGAGKDALACESYNPGFDSYVGTGLTAPILKRNGMTTFETWVNPPEFNFVLVSATGELLPNDGGPLQLVNWFANPRSFNCFSDGYGNPIETADPDGPDYRGRCVPLIIVDPTLSTQAAVNFMVRRYAQISLFATQCASFESYLLLVWDPADPHQRAPRPLRYYDPCQVNGVQFLVKDCNPHAHKDIQQIATYELVAPSDF